MNGDTGDESIFCAWEQQRFPKDQFKTYAEYGVVHEHPPGDVPKHTTSGQALPSEEAAVEKWSVPSQSFG